MTTVLHGNSVWWVCSCGELRTQNPRDAFQHRQDFHVVKPITDQELFFSQLPRELTGIEKYWNERVFDDIVGLAGWQKWFEELLATDVGEAA